MAIFIISACSNPPNPVIPEITQADTATIVHTPTITMIAASTQTHLPTSTPAPTLTATPDTRIPPERWKEWPIAPEVTNHSREIYQRGLTLGLDPHGFSKIGDCQNVSSAFMGFFDTPDRYVLWSETEHLADAIAWFKGEFNTDGAAVRPGLTAAAAMTPLWADPKLCQATENPVACEIRINRPTYVIISFELWWDGRTPESYEKYMRQVIEYVISQGVVPILATKADNVEGDHAINLTTAKLAYEYDIPLWNFWRAVQTLEYHGMDASRHDGFHISVEAWNTRSYSALESLNSIWKELTGTD